MELVVACCLAGVVILAHLLLLQSEWLAWRNARRGCYDLDQLQARTGILSRPELEAVVGSPGPDSLYRVDAATFARLPRSNPVAQVLLGPSLGFSALLLASVGLGFSLYLGEPAWSWIAAALGAFFVEVVVITVYMTWWSPDDEVDDPELPSDEELDQLGAIQSVRALGALLDGELRRIERSQQRLANHGGLTWAERSLRTLADRWSRRSCRRERLRVAKLLESSEALAEQIRLQRDALRVLIRASDDLDEAVKLCEHELHVERVLRDLEGEG